MILAGVARVWFVALVFAQFAAGDHGLFGRLVSRRAVAGHCGFAGRDDELGPVHHAGRCLHRWLVGGDPPGELLSPRSSKARAGRSPERGLRAAWIPCLLSAGTTSLGLISLCTGAIVPIKTFLGSTRPWA